MQSTLRPARLRPRRAARSLAASATATPGGDPRAVPPPAHCDIVRGPSLLRTSRLDRPRPSLLQLPGLRALPFWTRLDESGGETQVAYQDGAVARAVAHLEAHWAGIREEYHRVAPRLKSDYETDTEHHTLHEGTWDWHSYMTKGKLCGTFATHFPETFRVLQTLRDERLLFEGTPFGYAFFSTLHARSRIAAHAAPMNLRLRVHLPLVVPPPEPAGVADAAASGGRDAAPPPGAQRPVPCGIRVGSGVREWTPGRALVLDDAFDHEAWNDTPAPRVVLLVDLWHPDVTMEERAEIVQLFEHARSQGYMS